MAWHGLSDGQLKKLVEMFYSYQSADVLGGPEAFNDTEKAMKPFPASLVVV